MYYKLTNKYEVSIMSKNKTYKIEEKKKNKSKVIKGGYVSSLTGVSQSDRAELFKEQRRGYR